MSDNNKRVCIKPDCEHPAIARRLCNSHYQKWRRANLNTLNSPDGDARMGFCARLAELLSEAPDDLLTQTEKEVILGIAMTAAMAARGIVPLTSEMRAAVLHQAVDRITAKTAQ